MWSLLWKPLLVVLFWDLLLTATLMMGPRRPLVLRLPFLLLLSLVLFVAWALWPRNFGPLRRQEAELDRAIVPTVTAREAEDIIRSKGLPLRVWQISRESCQLGWDAGRQLCEIESTWTNGRMVRTLAYPGEHVIWSQGQQTAFRFPCGYGVEVHLVFEPNGRLRLRRIGDYRLCP